MSYILNVYPISNILCPIYYILYLISFILHLYTWLSYMMVFPLEERVKLCHLTLVHTNLVLPEEVRSKENKKITFWHVFSVRLFVLNLYMFTHLLFLYFHRMYSVLWNRLMREWLSERGILDPTRLQTIGGWKGGCTMFIFDKVKGPIISYINHNTAPFSVRLSFIFLYSFS